MWKKTAFSLEFTGQRTQILSHDHAHHLECSDCHYQTLVAGVSLSTKQFSSVQCSLSSIFRVQAQIVQVGVKNMLGLRWNQRAHYWIWGRPKGHTALWKRPSENTVPHVNLVRVYGFLVHESNQEALEGVLIGSGMQPTNHISDLHIMWCTALVLSPLDQEGNVHCSPKRSWEGYLSPHTNILCWALPHMRLFTVYTT